MSVVVSLAELPAAIERQIGWCYLLTVSDQSSARAVAIAPAWGHESGTLTAEVGRRTADNAAARPSVSMVWPPADPYGYSLIVDGTVQVHDVTITFTPTSAVMHRPAISLADS
ncbi:MAG: pyridoxamine 5'-phosphate oxidase family protein [Actinomycetota bacterium]